MNMHTDPGTSPRKRYGMVFDMDACVGCQTCTIACKQTNQTTPGILWRNVLDLEVGEYPQVDRTFLLTGCQHCDNPPCVPVCPTGATYQRDDGLVVIDEDICIGCSSCVVACPYQARKIDKNPPAYYPGERMPTEQRPVQLRRVGVAQKCSFCKDRVDDGLARGLVPGVDPDATAACANACISQAITFGDLADPASPVSRKLAASQGGRQMHDHLGTNPHIFYIGERRANDMRPGPLQSSWDIRAAMNFICGGMSSALFVWAWLAHVLFDLPHPVLRWLDMLAAVLMATGLFFVFLKLGRKLRFWRVITRWQTSWMTRETWCVALIYASLFVSWAWPGQLWDALVAVGGAGFLWCQGRILHASRGIPAWRHDAVPALLTLTGLLEGAGWMTLVLVLLLTAGMPLGEAASPTALFQACGATLALCGGAMAMLWPRYVREVSEETAGRLESMSRWLGPAGHWPAVLVGLWLMVDPAHPLALGAALLVSVAVVTTGALLKFQLVVRAAHFQGTRIPSGPGRTWKNAPTAMNP